MSAKILIVDDSGLARRLTRQMLEEAGHTVEDVDNGSTALERYTLNRHDLVVLDMVMHGMRGQDVLATLHQINPALPVIIVTADIQKSTREQVKESGAAAILNKPLNKEEFISVVNKILAGEVAWT